MAEDEVAGARERERSVYRAALTEFRDLPTVKTDANPQVASRFMQLEPHVRLFLQVLSSKDVSTLAGIIVHAQRVGQGLRFAKWGVTWAVGAFVAAVVAGEKLKTALEWFGRLVW